MYVILVMIILVHEHTTNITVITATADSTSRILAIGHVEVYLQAGGKL